MGVRLTTKDIHDQIRERILNGELADRPISQVQLSKDLGVSRTPLREALRLLEREGLIQSEPNRRVRVPRMSIAELEELYAMRVVLEALALRLSCRSLTAKDFKLIESCRVQMERLSGRDIDAWEEAHRRYHEQFTAYSGKQFTQLLRRLSDHTYRYRRSYLTEPRAWTAAADEHRVILEACRARNLSETTLQLARHLARTALSLVASLDPAHDPMPIREALRQVTGMLEPVAAAR
jgi:DNA-binding GntR family transcriptional regulator